MLFHRELAANLNVCSNCDHHMAITPRERFAALFDGGIFTEVKVPEPPWSIRCISATRRNTPTG
jgi:acetyl-CoA carboxylase carboxyl transferase subunit beta